MLSLPSLMPAIVSNGFRALIQRQNSASMAEVFGDTASVLHGIHAQVIPRVSERLTRTCSARQPGLERTLQSTEPTRTHRARPGGSRRRRTGPAGGGCAEWLRAKRRDRRSLLLGLRVPAAAEPRGSGSGSGGLSAAAAPRGAPGSGCAARAAQPACWPRLPRPWPARPAAWPCPRGG